MHKALTLERRANVDLFGAREGREWHARPGGRGLDGWPNQTAALIERLEMPTHTRGR